jgi:hypothetical protein
MLMTASMISRKGKHALSRGFGRYRILQGLRWRQIDADAEHVGKSVFGRDHVQKRQTREGSNSAMMSTSEASRTMVPRASEPCRNK